jgi:hypothetical protein
VFLLLLSVRSASWIISVVLIYFWLNLVADKSKELVCLSIFWLRAFELGYALAFLGVV